MNILLLTTGCANSTIIVKMLGKLGWNLNDADEEYAESVEARRINIAFLKSGRFDSTAASTWLASLRSPWVVKDPRFSDTIHKWRPLMTAFRPMMLYVTKDLAYVGASMKRRFAMSPDIAESRPADHDGGTVVLHSELQTTTAPLTVHVLCMSGRPLAAQSVGPSALPSVAQLRNPEFMSVIEV